MRPTPIKNALVCMFDGWQFNYNGCYGNDWIKTPNFDRFAREGVLFENAYSNSLPTLPVRRSMMTGRYTLHDIGWGPLREQDTTIADLCWGTDVDSGIAYNSLPMMMTKGGYARSFAYCKYSRGFDRKFFEKDLLFSQYTFENFFDDPGFLERLSKHPDGVTLMKALRTEFDQFIRDKQYWKSEENQPVVTCTRDAIRMLEEADRNHPFFIWVDNWDPHEPWDPPSVWDPEMKCPYDPDYEGKDMWFPPFMPVKDVFTEPQLNHIRMLYAEKVTLCDKYFGILMDAVRRLGYEENTLVWLCSDHGEPMGNGEHGHGLMCKCRPWPYEELVHIPMMVRAPGLPAGKRIKSFVQDCDCAPTILDWLGLPVPPNMTGVSLLPLCRGEVEKVRDFAIAGYYDASWSIITEDWSFIHWLDKLEHASYAEGMAKVVGDVFKKFHTELSDTFSKAVEEENALATLDGEAQWTCTHGARMEVPEGDELYDRQTDPFQLHNVIDQYPDVAHKLYMQLTVFLDDLKSR